VTIWRAIVVQLEPALVVQVVLVPLDLLGVPVLPVQLVLLVLQVLLVLPVQLVLPVLLVLRVQQVLQAPDLLV
jgi:hypothetical protein